MKEVLANNNKLLCFVFTLLLLLGGAGIAGAQTRKISGNVYDERGQPLPGVSVSIKGTTTGVATDVKGGFQLQVNAADNTLRISMLGYKVQDVAITTGSMNITLIERSAELREVVVLGYGSTTKKEITGSVAVIKGSQIANMAVHSAADILQGKASGVTVSQSSGTPGAGAVVRIRGIGSINGSGEPLYVVDGLPQTDINYLNPNDIESIAVHKDASVAAIYGSRASNGVIIVTTKSGSKNDKVTVAYDNYVGFQSPWKRPEVLSVAGFIQYKNLAAKNAGAASLLDFSNQTNIDSVLNFVAANGNANGTDWWNEITHYNAPIQNHNVSVSGGSKTVSFVSSLAYMNQKGIVLGSDFQRISWRNNVNAQVSKRLKITTNLGLIYDARHLIDENNPFTGTIFSAKTADPITPVYRSNLQGLPSFLSGINTGYEPNNPFSLYSGVLYSNKRNPVAQIYRMEQSKYENLGIKGGITAEFNIIRPLTFQSRVGMDLNRSFQNGFTPKYFLNASDKSDVNGVSNFSFSSNYFVYENTLTYDQTWGKFHVTGLGGVSSEVTNASQFSASILGLVNNDPDMRILSAGTTTPAVSGYPFATALNSYFARVGFDYDGKYIIAGNIRRDGSSKFADGNRWGTFPSVSAAWRFTQEELFKPTSNWLTDGKLRASYGLIGNQNIGAGQYLSTYGSTVYDRYEFGTDNTVSIGGGRISAGNPVLQWETSKQLDIGLDLSFFESKLTFTADYFKKKIDNMLLIVPLASAIGYPNSPYTNAGNMENRGWEFELAYRNNISGFTYGVSGNISAYRNKVTKLGNGDPIYATAHLGEVITKTEVGQPVGYYYGYKTNGIFQNAQEVENSPQRDVSTPGDIRFKDINGDGILDASDRTKIGDPWPDFVYGLTFNAAYKGFDISVFVQGSQGNNVMNIERYDTESGTGFYNAPQGFIEKSWSGEGSTDHYHKISQIQGLNNSVSDYFVEDGSYMRLKNVQLGYSFKSSLLQKAKLSQCRIFVGAQNLLTITGYSGLDPEIGSGDAKLNGIDQGFYPQARTFMIGINAKF